MINKPRPFHPIALFNPFFPYFYIKCNIIFPHIHLKNTCSFDNREVYEKKIKYQTRQIRYDAFIYYFDFYLIESHLFIQEIIVWTRFSKDDLIIILVKRILNSMIGIPYFIRCTPNNDDTPFLFCISSFK